MNQDELARLVAAAIKPEIERQMKPFLERISELEAREVQQGERGDDGISPSAEDVAACFERRFSEFLLAGERRIYEMADKAIDRMPRAKDGRDGVDGVGWDSMSVEYDGERTITLVYDKGDEQLTYPITFPVVLDKGFWKEGNAAEPGDGYTFGGSYWIAQKDTETKPETGNPDWRLAVKKGRDGKK